MVKQVYGPRRKEREEGIETEVEGMKNMDEILSRRDQEFYFQTLVSEQNPFTRLWRGK